MASTLKLWTKAAQNNRLIRAAIVSFVLIMSCGPSFGANLQSMTTARELGSLLASEELCQLKFKQDAIRAFIEKNVAADDMSFPPTLQTMIGGAKFELNGMSESARTAHCAQVRRISISYGFIEKQ